MAEQTVTLQPGESKVVSFEAIPSVAKTFQVIVDGLSGSFRAIAKPAIVIAANVGIALYDRNDNLVTGNLIRGGYYEVRLMVDNKSTKTPVPPGGLDWIPARLIFGVSATINSIQLISYENTEYFGGGESIPFVYGLSLPDNQEGTVLIKAWVKDTDGNILGTDNKSYVIPTAPYPDSYYRIEGSTYMNYSEQYIACGVGFFSRLGISGTMAFREVKGGNQVSLTVMGFPRSVPDDNPYWYHFTLPYGHSMQCWLIPATGQTWPGYENASANYWRCVYTLG